jgi:hypothetical protein
MWDWPCSKFLALHCINLYAVGNPHPVHRNFCRFLLAYGLWNALFVSLENTFEFSAILSMIPISKQLNGSRRANYQETREGCCQQPEGSFSGIKRPWPIIGSESKILVSCTSLSTARCEAAYPSRVITFGAPCCLTAREKNRLASENG